MEQKSMEHGYARISTKNQKEDRQIIALVEQGIEADNVFLDKCSGKDFNRKQYQKLLSQLNENDTIFIKSLDRLGRIYDEILEQWKYITREKQAHIVVLDMPLLDTRMKHESDLTGKFISDLVLQVLSYVAETERLFNRQRQAEGIAVAKAKGIRFGRPTNGNIELFPELYAKWYAGNISARKASRQMGVSHATFLCCARQYTVEESGQNPHFLTTPVIHPKSS